MSVYAPLGLNVLIDAPYMLFVPNFSQDFTHLRVILRSMHWRFSDTMMTSSNGNIFRVTGSLCGEFTGPGDFPTQRPVTRSFDVFFDLRLNKRLSKQPCGWWFETLSWSLWRHCNDRLKKWLADNSHQCVCRFTDRSAEHYHSDSSRYLPALG